jgi:predicted aspartyl protease
MRVDTGATHLCLPADVIAALGLPLQREVEVETAFGKSIMRVFEGARVEINGRADIFSCIELDEGRPPLLGVVAMESMGLRPDLQSHTLELLPETGPHTHFMI